MLTTTRTRVLSIVGSTERPICRVIILETALTLACIRRKKKCFIYIKYINFILHNVGNVINKRWACEGTRHCAG